MSVQTRTHRARTRPPRRKAPRNPSPSKLRPASGSTRDRRRADRLDSRASGNRGHRCGRRTRSRVRGDRVEHSTPIAAAPAETGGIGRTPEHTPPLTPFLDTRPSSGRRAPLPRSACRPSPTPMATTPGSPSNRPGPLSTSSPARIARQGRRGADRIRKPGLRDLRRRVAEDSRTPQGTRETDAQAVAGPREQAEPGPKLIAGSPIAAWRRRSAPRGWRQRLRLFRSLFVALQAVDACRDDTYCTPAGDAGIDGLA